MANTNPAHIVLRDVRLSYVHLFEAYANQPGQEPKYSTTVLVPKYSNQKYLIDSAIAAAVQRAQERFGKAFPQTPKTSVHDGDGLRPSDGQPFGDECKGHWVFTASCKQRPKVVDQNLQDIINPIEIYSGIYANVGITFFGYNAPQNKGVGVGLENIQKIRDGESLGGGRVAAEDDFAPISQPQQASPVTQPQAYAPQPAEYNQPAYAQQQPAVYPQQYNQPQAYTPQPVEYNQPAYAPQQPEVYPQQYSQPQAYAPQPAEYNQPTYAPQQPTYNQPIPHYFEAAQPQYQDQNNLPI